MLVTIGTLRVKAQSFKFNFSATLENCWLLASYPEKQISRAWNLAGHAYRHIERKDFSKLPTYH